MREPRSKTLARYVEQALRHTRTTERSYAAEVVELYHARTALHERTVEFHMGTTAAQVDAAMRANTQLVRRMLDGTVRLPADLEEAMVLALPEPYREDCIADLAARLDRLAVRAPSPEGAASLNTLGGWVRETGEALTKLGEMLHDGQIDQADAPLARTALKELGDVERMCLGLMAQLQGVLRAAEQGRPLRAVK